VRRGYDLLGYDSSAWVWSTRLWQFSGCHSPRNKNNITVLNWFHAYASWAQALWDIFDLIRDCQDCCVMLCDAVVAHLAQAIPVVGNDQGNGTCYKWLLTPFVIHLHIGLIQKCIDCIDCVEIMITGRFENTVILIVIFGACKRLSDKVLAWLSVCSEVQMIYIWSGWYPMPPDHITSCFIKIQIGFIFLVSPYQLYPGKGAVKHVSVFLVPEVTTAAYYGQRQLVIFMYFYVSFTGQQFRAFRLNTEVTCSRLITFIIVESSFHKAFSICLCVTHL